MKHTRFLLPLFFALYFQTNLKTEYNFTNKPRVSIITSVFKGDEYIKSFLQHIINIKNFHECELILINANSPGNEEQVILEYQKIYPNIIYQKLDKDPGLYAVWNYAIEHKSRADFITNCNLDDRTNPEIIAQFAQALEDNPDIDLVYSDYLLTYEQPHAFAHNGSRYIVPTLEFDPAQLFNCLPGPQPMWRKSMHNKYGYFRDDFYVSGDLEMWNRAACQGSRFKKIPGYSTMCYHNPTGLSTTKEDARANARLQENIFIQAAYGYLWNQAPASPKLLIKIPTRSRPIQFFKQLNNYYRNLSGKVSYHFLISCDNDDVTMNNPAVIKRLKSYPNLSFSFKNNASKIEAYNRDLDNRDFDILLAASDDLEPVIWGYDQTIANNMKENFPDYDGVLNYHDGNVGPACNTLPIIGKNFYKRFGYLFNPKYLSLSANEELTLVSRMLGKEYISNDVILRHNHPVWGLGQWDDLYYKNEALKERDNAVFCQRRAHNFDLGQDGYKKEWSILICTLQERETKFKQLYQDLMNQIRSLDLENKIEVLYIKDNREIKVGKKRNLLVHQSQGKYISFIDDDDLVHPQYIKMIYQKLQDDPDCVSLVGIMTTNGKDPHKFIHSIKYNDKYAQEDGVYYRPPNHLNVIRKTIASQFLFPESNMGEDKDWALSIARSGLLKKEAVINEPYYFYQYDGKYDDVKTGVAGYYVTAADSSYFESLLNCIGSLYQSNGNNFAGIAIINLGLTDQQINHLKTIKNVHVLELEKAHPDILKPFVVNNSGKVVPGWYAWKPGAIKQALEIFPYVLWLDSSCIVFKPLDHLFEYIRDNGYFLATIGNEVDNNKFRHPLSWCTTQLVIQEFGLNSPEKEWILSQEQIMAGFLGVSRSGHSAFLDQWFEYSKNLKYFADDGSTPDGFGTGRHDLALLSAIAYTKALTCHRQDYTQQKPINLANNAQFYITWHGQYVSDKTHVYTARGDCARFGYLRNSISYKK